MTQQIVLSCKSVWYYSEIDEELFFEWIKKILSIIKHDGIGDKLFLYFENKHIDDNDLRELLALFFRYQIDMTQLVVFLSESNKKWFFENHTAYWQEQVFGVIKKQ